MLGVNVVTSEVSLAVTVVLLLIAVTFKVALTLELLLHWLTTFRLVPVHRSRCFGVPCVPFLPFIQQHNKLKAQPMSRPTPVDALCVCLLVLSSAYFFYFL